MKNVSGLYTSAKIFTDTIEDYALAQIQKLCDHPVFEGSQIRIMPDVHPGYVGTIGFTATVTDRIMPNIVGSDIGCGMTIARLKQKKLEFQKLDTVIRENIPSGAQIRKKPHRFAEEFCRFDMVESEKTESGISASKKCESPNYDSKTAGLGDLRCVAHINQDKAMKSMGTLGGGNHFIEVDKGNDGSLYIVIHSGSRHLGKEVTDYYLKAGHRHLKAQNIDVPYELTWLEGALMEDYIHDLQIIQEYAEQNRNAILDELVKGMKLKVLESYSCVHNYVDIGAENAGITTNRVDISTGKVDIITSAVDMVAEAVDININGMDIAANNIDKNTNSVDSAAAVQAKYMILRKGAISAQQGERVIIPVNMRDGIILGIGKGNPDWNDSAPHGAGRVMNRTSVKEQFTVSAFKKEMKGIYSTCIGKDTLDEAPFAYRNLDQITEALHETVEITEILKPVYNYKAGGEE